MGAVLVPVAQAQGVTTQDLQVQVEALQAQILQLQEQLQRFPIPPPDPPLPPGPIFPVPPPEPPICYAFTTTLRQGDVGDAVRDLQSALQSEGVYRGSITGVFDSATHESAVSFQEKYQSEVLDPFGITIGTGYVGRTSNAQLNRLYGCPFPIPIPIPIPDNNLPPVIDGVAGPSSLLVGEQGTWTVKAHDPEQGKLWYEVNWGDEFRILEAAPSVFPDPGSGQTTTFTHSYANVGRYTITFTVTDETRQQAKTSITTSVVKSDPINRSPQILKFPVIPEDIQPGQGVRFDWGALDADGDKLSWSVSWGDGTGITGSCQISPPPPVIGTPSSVFGELEQFTTKHAWANAGVYTVTTTVFDCKGGSDTHRLSITVGNDVITPSITVLSPTSGVVGTTVIVTGSRFTKTENTVNFGNGFIGGLTSANGTTLQFIVPAGLSICSPLMEFCPLVSLIVNSGTYDVSVTNANGTSNRLTFTVLGEIVTPSITVLSPNGGEQLTIGESYGITWASTGFEKVFITLINEGLPGTFGQKYWTCRLTPGYVSGEQGKYSWNVGSDGCQVSPGDKFKIKVSQPEGTIQPRADDESDNYFSISEGGIVIPPIGSKHLRGSATAAVTLEGWVDYQSPFSRRFEPTVNRVLDEYSGKVNLVVKHFPLAAIHPLAIKGAQATECAAVQDEKYFWILHDWLLSSAGSDWDVDIIKRFVAGIDIDEFNASEFNVCLDSGRMASVINEYIEQGKAKNITGIPTTFVIRNRDGASEKVVGAVQYETLKTVVDKMLGEVFSKSSITGVSLLPTKQNSSFQIELVQ